MLIKQLCCEFKRVDHKTLYFNPKVLEGWKVGATLKAFEIVWNNKTNKSRKFGKGFDIKVSGTFARKVREK